MHSASWHGRTRACLRPVGRLAKRRRRPRAAAARLRFSASALRRARRPRRRASVSSAARPRRGPSGEGRRNAGTWRAAASSSRQHPRRRSGSSAWARAASSPAGRAGASRGPPAGKRSPAAPARPLGCDGLCLRADSTSFRASSDRVACRALADGAPRKRAHRGPHDVRERLERALVGRGEASLAILAAATMQGVALRGTGEVVAAKWLRASSLRANFAAEGGRLRVVQQMRPKRG